MQRHAGLGRRTDLTAELQQLGAEGFTAGRVLAQYPDRWLVATIDSEKPPALVPARGRLRLSASGAPVTGDWVALDENGAIAVVLERRGTIIRRAAGPAGGAQVLAANVDLALVVEPLPDPSDRRVERMLALASAGDVPAVLILTKADLDPEAWEVAAPLARRLGLPDAIAVSSIDGEGLGMLRAMLEPGATSVLLGPSGAGKSTLVNALLGEERQATGAVREHDGRGRHTTVIRELITLADGALLIDTPGIREAGLWDGTGDSFADIDEAAAGCRFADCAHLAEPDCAVNATVNPERVAAWHKLVEEQSLVDARRGLTRR